MVTVDTFNAAFFVLSLCYIFQESKKTELGMIGCCFHFSWKDLLTNIIADRKLKETLINIL